MKKGEERKGGKRRKEVRKEGKVIGRQEKKRRKRETEELWGEQRTEKQERYRMGEGTENGRGGEEVSVRKG